MPPCVATRQPALDVLQPARQAGWLNSYAPRPDELLCGAALLPLAGHQIAVRLVLFEPAIDALLELLLRDLRTSFFIEQYVILEGFSAEARATFTAQLRTPGRRLLAGTYLEYCGWVKARIGAVGALGQTALRALAEPFLACSGQPDPRERITAQLDFSKSALDESFTLGAKGVQAIETLFRHTLGQRQVENVEADPAWREKDVDLLTKGLLSGTAKWGAVEVKAENKTSENLALETVSNMTRKTPGWLMYSAADVLLSCLWPSGDALLMDFQEVKRWALAPATALEPRAGWAKGQKYKSRILLAPVDRILAEVTGSLWFRIQDWLPTSYGTEFEHPCQVSPRHQAKRLMPHRPD